MTRILVVDDDHKIVRLVRAYLEKADYEVLTAFDGETALHSIRHDEPDLVVLDLMLPDKDGWEITRIVRQDATLAKLPIIMLTARVEDADRIDGLELGADDYISKPFNPREMVARVRAVLRRTGGGDLIVETNRLTIDLVSMDLAQHRVTCCQEPLELTPTEFSLLRLLMENPGRAFTRTEMIDKALGYSYIGMERTMDSHIKNLRKKLALSKESPAYIETVHGVGYRLRGEA